MSDTRTTEASGEKLPPDQREVCRSVGSQSHLFIQRWPEDLTNTVSTRAHTYTSHTSHMNKHMYTQTHTCITHAHRHTYHT